jgi:phosphoribosylanthranilate isomerase
VKKSFPKVKICCINSLEEAQLAIDYGASALGLVGPMPSGPGVIKDDLIAEIAAKIPTDIETFLLTSETHVDDIISHHERTKTTTIQLVDKLKNGAHKDLRAALPEVKLVQVIHVLGEKTIDEALEASASVDYLLLDSGNPNLKVRELGGTGRVHNWNISKRIVELSDIPVFLAGGLRPDNVGKAIKAVNPYGLDLCSGVRTGGLLDTLKLKAFFSAVLPN